MLCFCFFIKIDMKNFYVFSLQIKNKLYCTATGWSLIRWRFLTVTMRRWQQVVFNPRRILFSVPQLSNSLYLLGVRVTSQGHIDSHSACRRMMWFLEDLDEFQGFWEQTVFVFICVRGSDNHVDITYNTFQSAGCCVTNGRLPSSADCHWRWCHTTHHLPLQ